MTKIATLNADIATVARERAAPVAAEMDVLGEQVIEFATTRLKQEGEAAAANIAFLQMVALAFGGAVVLLLIGSCVFSMFTIARPMRALTAGMLELADGNFDVVLPGLGRKDEIGDVAAAVETFKIKSAEKAQAEAAGQGRARTARKRAKRAERERIAAEEKRRAGSPRRRRSARPRPPR